MKIYLAGPCDSENRTLMMNIAQKIRTSVYDDIELYCPFELKIENAWDYTQEVWAEKVFNADIAVIKECDAMILITPGRISSAGTNWEQGYAYALGKKVYVLQITDASTSLMTYCGCNYFANATKDTIFYQISAILDDIKYKFDSGKSKCTTILT